MKNSWGEKVYVRLQRGKGGMDECGFLLNHHRIPSSAAWSHSELWSEKRLVRTLRPSDFRVVPQGMNYGLHVARDVFRRRPSTPTVEDEVEGVCGQYTPHTAAHLSSLFPV